MRSILDELHQELSDLNALIASIKPVNTVLSNQSDSLVQKYIVIRRRFDYAAFVVALYASFEKFIEDLVVGYLRLESRRVAYNALPAKLVKKHLEKSADMLARARVGEGRYADVSHFDIVKNLFDCLNGSAVYSLNGQALLMHDSNFRVPQVEELFAMIGIENICDSMRRADAMVEWYTAVESEPSQDGVKRQIIETRLNEIVERRNYVAHRGNTSDLLGADSMSEAVGFILSFCSSIYSIVVGHYLRDHYVRASTGGELRHSLENSWYKKGYVVVIDKPEHTLSVGQQAFVLTPSGARWGRIQSLQLDGNSVPLVDQSTPAPKGIGVGLNFKCPKESSLYVLPSDDDVIWSPQ